MSKSGIVIGTRGSKLALWQAHHIQGQLEKYGYQVEIRIVKTQGDIIQHLSFDKMEGKGFFTKEIETELLDRNVDLAVHSFKDLETNFPDGLTIGAVTDRANPRDALLIRKDKVDSLQKWGFKKGALVGTSSARRKVQLLKYRPDINIGDIRGNVPTRVQKLRDGNFDAIVLAKAGLDRLQLDVSDFHLHVFDPNEFIPAPAQGALALQIRENDQRMEEAISKLHREDIATTTYIERKVLSLFNGGCQMPLGSYCVMTELGQYELRAMMAETLNSKPVNVYLSGNCPENLARRAVKELKSKALEGIS
ncbi:MAG: hydroxymethylbilane synthase [Flavobacteriales bacterium]|nr:hydroxymethylbilane synthase [Flavobacteriales bacterium]